MTEEKKEGKSWYEEFRVSGGEILNKVKEIIHEGNVRRIILKDDQGKTFMETPPDGRRGRRPRRAHPGRRGGRRRAGLEPDHRRREDRGLTPARGLLPRLLSML